MATQADLLTAIAGCLALASQVEQRPQLPADLARLQAWRAGVAQFAEAVRAGAVPSALFSHWADTVELQRQNFETYLENASDGVAAVPGR